MASIHEHMKRHKAAVRRKKSATGSVNSDGFSVGDGWVEGWISTADVDSDGEYVPPNEWVTEIHEKNPVALLNHDREGPVVGRWAHPDGKYSIEKRSNGLWGRCYFNLNTEAGREEYASYKGGFKRGFSPGFYSQRPERGVVNGKTASILRKAHVFEVSLVGIPANQNALAVNCKSAAGVTGKYAIPPGNVLRLGAFKMADETTPEVKSEPVITKPEPKPGVRGFLDTMVSGLTSVFAEAKACLATVTTDERHEAYGMAGDAYVCAKSMCAVGREKFKDMPWDDAEAAVEKEFEGFGKAIEIQNAEDDAVTEEHLKSLIAKELESVIADIAAVKIVADNHEQAIEGILDTVESTALAN